MAVATPKIIILDFDGVIVESNSIKDLAFDRLFRDEPKHHAEIMAYHLAHNAVDRHEKFRYIAECILHREPTTELLSQWALQFSKDTRQAIISCPFVPGAEDFLRKFHDKIPLYLASATPQDELDLIVKARKIRHYFVEVFGAPEKKRVMISKVLARESAAPEDCLFVGDSQEDWASAEEMGIGFIGRRGRSEFHSAGFPVIYDLHDLNKYVSPGFVEAVCA